MKLQIITRVRGKDTAILSDFFAIKRVSRKDKKMKKAWIAALAVAFCLSGCSSPSVPSGEDPFENVDVSSLPNIEDVYGETSEQDIQEAFGTSDLSGLLSDDDDLGLFGELLMWPSEHALMKGVPEFYGSFLVNSNVTDTAIDLEYEGVENASFSDYKKSLKDAGFTENSSDTPSEFSGKKDKTTVAVTYNSADAKLKIKITG